MHDEPVFSMQAKQRVDAFVDRITRHAIEWAKLLAKRDGEEVITDKHIAEVERIIAKFPRTERVHPEIETAVGGFVFGLAMAMPDVLGALLPNNWQWTSGIIFWSVIILMITGASLAIHGWIRAR